MTARLLAAGFALLLGACATMDPPPAPTLRTVTVDRPVPVPCRVDLPAAPAWAVDRLPRDANVDAIMAAALAELEQRIGYELQLVAGLETCRAP